jgi:hypothetical protein
MPETKVKVEALTSRAGRPMVYLVKRGNEVVGMLEKYRDTRNECHPLKAFRGTGYERQNVGHFYDDRARASVSVRFQPNYNFGGRPAALRAIAGE